MLSLVLWLFISQAQAQGHCAEIFAPTEGAVAATFTRIQPAFLETHDSRYDVDLMSGPVRNQCASPLCHLYAWAEVLPNTHGIALSRTFLNSAHYKHAALKALKDESLKLSLGENPTDSIEALRRYGLVPEEVWSGNPDFIRNPEMARLNEMIESILARAKYLRGRVETEEALRAVEESAKDQIEVIIEDILGHAPTEFKYRGRSYSPQSFASTFFPELASPIVRLAVSVNADMPPQGYRDAAGNFILRADINHVRRIAGDVLDSNQLLFLSYFVQHQFADWSSGVLSVAAFKSMPWSEPLPRHVRNTLGAYDRLHAVALGGYQRDLRNGFIKWKLKNSWGEDSGDGGYLHMYDDYFGSYVTDIVFIATDPRMVPLFREVAETSPTD